MGGSFLLVALARFLRTWSSRQRVVEGNSSSWPRLSDKVRKDHRGVDPIVDEEMLATCLTRVSPCSGCPPEILFPETLVRYWQRNVWFWERGVSWDWEP